jgi:hypothetical protein
VTTVEMFMSVAIDSLKTISFCLSVALSEAYSIKNLTRVTGGRVVVC